ncbi:MAG: VOC family protein [Flavobacteriaceae bacterium]
MKRIILALIMPSLVFMSCTDSKAIKDTQAKIDALQIANDSLKHVLDNHNPVKKNQIATFLTFQNNNAETAMHFYIDIFENSKIIEVKRWEKDAPVEEGKIMHATFNLNGKTFMCSDSPPIHEWGFTPAVSNYIDCEDDDELVRLFTKLSENGKVLMPLNNYGFSQKFGFIEDQFGVSWQLNLK